MNGRPAATTEVVIALFLTYVKLEWGSPARGLMLGQGRQTGIGTIDWKAIMSLVQGKKDFFDGTWNQKTNHELEVGLAAVRLT